VSKKRVKYIFRKIRQANLAYNLIESGDRVAAGLSGGKDSLTLLYFLRLLQKYTPLEFTIYPMYIDLGFGNNIEALKSYCRDLGMPLVVRRTNISRIVFEERKETNPCSLCSNLRNGALNRLAKEYSCNKVALAHHADDAVVTLFMSMIFAGQYRIFKPKTYLDRIDITSIRPLIYVHESEIISFVDSMGFTIVKNLCPQNYCSKRREVGLLLKELESRFPGARSNILSSLENIDRNSFWK
jgi:tRNA 2-thiocytidine biosynthesis protein TtcA